MDLSDFVNIRSMRDSAIGKNSVSYANGRYQKGVDATFKNNKIKVDGIEVATFSGQIDIIENKVYDVDGNFIIDLNNPI